MRRGFNFLSWNHWSTTAQAWLDFLCSKVLRNFLSTPLSEIDYFAPRRSRHKHQFQLAEKSASTNNILHGFQIRIMKVQNRLLAGILIDAFFHPLNYSWDGWCSCDWISIHTDYSLANVLLLVCAHLIFVYFPILIHWNIWK